MKRSKKLLALVLALVMSFSLMAVTAAAAGTEEHEHVCSTETVQPRGPVYICPVCGGEATWGVIERADGTVYVGLVCKTGHSGTTAL